MKVADPQLVADVCRILEHVAETQGYVTADDLRKLLPHLPHKRSAFGAAFETLLKNHTLVSAGFTHSKVPSNHGRRIAVYRLRSLKVCP